MTTKRIFLIILTAIALLSIGVNLWESWSQPQFQSRLELYQTNLVLQASELQTSNANEASTRKALIGEAPVKTALEQYQDLRQSAQQTLERLEAQAGEALPSPEVSPTNSTRELAASRLKSAQLVTELDLRIGLLQVAQSQTQAAQQTWATMIREAADRPSLEPLSKTAGALAGLWSDPARLLPDAEALLKKNLDGWFQTRALRQLYELQQRQEALDALKAQTQQQAEQAFNKLTIVGGIPILGCLIGVGILLFLAGQWVVQRKQALLSSATIPAWSTPWEGEVIWQVMIFGFFAVGQAIGLFIMPLLVAAIQQLAVSNPALLSDRAKAIYTLIQYLTIAAGTLGVLYVSIRPFLPLPDGWFQVKLRGNWFWWGLGGYFAALPLVILISVVNQKIWQGQGGSNPILPIVLESQDTLALVCFFITAAIAAPIFEELLFRGFLLPSLTRYFPIWGAIGLSGLIFAIAHLSLSEVLPLTVLGMVLGFVYARSRNLLASMLLHSLWNSGTLLSLFVLGRGS
jgi:membrane protease YdiL (CAAX protease family)